MIDSVINQLRLLLALQMSLLEMDRWQSKVVPTSAFGISIDLRSCWNGAPCRRFVDDHVVNREDCSIVIKVVWKTSGKALAEIAGFQQLELFMCRLMTLTYPATGISSLLDITWERESVVLSSRAQLAPHVQDVSTRLPRLQNQTATSLLHHTSGAFSP